MIKTRYEFHGGKLNRHRFTREEVETFCDSYTKDLTELRALGVLCHREELDNQPKVPGYLGPMWDGVRYIYRGAIKYDFQLSEEQKKEAEDCFAVLRYETQEVYNMLSN